MHLFKCLLCSTLYPENQLPLRALWKNLLPFRVNDLHVCLTWAQSFKGERSRDRAWKLPFSQSISSCSNFAKGSVTSFISLTWPTAFSQKRSFLESRGHLLNYFSLSQWTCAQLHSISCTDDISLPPVSSLRGKRLILSCFIFSLEMRIQWRSGDFRILIALGVWIPF